MSSPGQYHPFNSGSPAVQMSNQFSSSFTGPTFAKSNSGFGNFSNQFSGGFNNARNISAPSSYEPFHLSNAASNQNPQANFNNGRNPNLQPSFNQGNKFFAVDQSKSN